MPTPEFIAMLKDWGGWLALLAWVIIDKIIPYLIARSSQKDELDEKRTDAEIQAEAEERKFQHDLAIRREYNFENLVNSLNLLSKEIAAVVASGNTTNERIAAVHQAQLEHDREADKRSKELHNAMERVVQFHIAKPHKADVEAKSPP